MGADDGVNMKRLGRGTCECAPSRRSWWPTQLVNAIDDSPRADLKTDSHLCPIIVSFIAQNEKRRLADPDRVQSPQPCQGLALAMTRFSICLDGASSTLHGTETGHDGRLIERVKGGVVHDHRRDIHGGLGWLLTHPRLVVYKLACRTLARGRPNQSRLAVQEVQRTQIRYGEVTIPRPMESTSRWYELIRVELTL